MGIRGIGVWGLGVGDWGLGPRPVPQSPIPIPQSPFILIFPINKFLYVFVKLLII